jgi:15-cis-phytoene synthase
VDDATLCRQIVRTHARTFWLASHFLGATKRRSAFALYAFCRVADDIVDLARSTPADEIARRLTDHRRQLDDALGGHPSGPVFRELHRAVRLHHVPAAVLHELLDGIARDCDPSRYATWLELERYCEGVASTVGEMCTYVFGVPGGADARHDALRYARALGVAMQLTNILRDVGEDARYGRCYLPDDDLARFGLSRDHVLAAATARTGAPTAPRLAADPRWRRFMEFEVRRARSIYQAAMPGISLLEQDTRRCASACAWGYAGILGAIEERSYDTLHGRVSVGTWTRLSVLWDAWRDTGEPAVAPLRGGPALEWDVEREHESDELLRWA